MENDSNPSQDIITSLGYLCLGSRFKRLGERLQAGVAEVLAARGHAVQSAHLPILMALAVRGDANIGMLSQHVGISQPGITRAVAKLRALGLLKSVDDGADRRQTVLSLSKEGQALMEELRTTLFPAVDHAVAELCKSSQGDMLSELRAVETALDRTPLASRIEKEVAA